MNLICRFSTETPIVREYDFLFIEKKKKKIIIPVFLLNILS